MLLRILAAVLLAIGAGVILAGVVGSLTAALPLLVAWAAMSYLGPRPRH